MTQPSPSDNDTVSQFIRRAAKERPAPKEIHLLEPERRMGLRNQSGLIIGGLMGLIFGLTSQMVNVVLLIGVISLRAALVSLAITAALTLLGVLLGLIASSRSRHQTQIILGMIEALFLLILVGMLIWGKGNLFLRVAQAAQPIFLLSWVLLGVGVVAAPLIAALYFAAELQAKYFYRPWWSWQRMLLPLLILLLAGWSGSWFILSKGEQRAMRGMDALMKRGFGVMEEADLPSELRKMEGPKFFDFAAGQYQLFSQQVGDMDDFPFVQSIRKEDVIVRADFENGYWMECRFAPGGTLLRCWSHYEPEVPDPNG